VHLESWRDLLAWTPALQFGGQAKLERFAAIARLFEQSFGPLPRLIKISGTSGKGSVAAMLEAALLEDGQSVGLFTSPHLICATERIRLDGLSIDSAELDTLTRATAPFFARILEELGPEFRPTFFEALLVLALRAFQLRGVDFAVLEVAVGGSIDVVSLLPGELAVITSIGRDHLAEIGPRLEDVAADKAGIASPGSTLLLGPAISPELLEVVRQNAAARAVEVIVADGSLIKTRSLGLRGHAMSIENDGSRLSFELPLAGAHQLGNLALVERTIALLASRGLVKSRSSIRGVAATKWPARLEFFPGQPDFLLDAAHNEPSFYALRDFIDKHKLEENLPVTDWLLLFGASEIDKALLAETILAPLFRRAYFTAGFHRAVSWDDLPPALREKGWRHFRNPSEALAELSQNEPTATVVVAGSLFLAGACRELLLRR